MSTTTKAQVSSSVAAPIVALKGRNKAAREAAYFSIAPLAMVENMSRVQTIDNLKLALGTEPSVEEIRAAQTEWRIGRVAGRLASTEFPKTVTNNAEKLEHARNLILFYVAPAKDGTTPRPLRASEIGRRSIEQHRVIRASEEAWSMLVSEAGYGKAKTPQQKTAQSKTRATNANPVRGAGKAGTATPEHSDLVKPAVPLSRAEAMTFVMTQAAMLQQYVNKNAKVVPTGIGTAVLAFKKAMNAAANEAALEDARADAERAEREKD